MAESTLSLDYDDFAAEVGHFIGWKRDSTAWSSDQAASIAEVVNSGYRRFLYPPPIPPAKAAYVWRFLRPITTLTAWASVSSTITGTTTSTISDSSGPFHASMVGKNIVSTNGSYTITAYVSSTQVSVDSDPTADDGESYTIAADGSYRLPDDFGGMIGRPTYGTSELSPRPAGIEMTNEARLRAIMQGTNTTSGRPDTGAVRPLAGSGTDGQRFELLLWPIPSGDFVLTYQYNILVGKLDSTNKYPLGGMMHGETIMQACRAVAEQKFFDTRGVEWETFMAMLATSIAHDRSLLSGDHYGYNADEPDHIRWRRTNAVTVNGVQY